MTHVTCHRVGDEFGHGVGELGSGRRPDNLARTRCRVAGAVSGSVETSLES
ncbi:hypothetical protein Q8W71_15500 [Methylobacterium sp. NEAU 140]|nr:hypothetical protein [Methylobacterium sp. NEAU 140]MDP4024034.1 hypothetical protein [Methylobacterium sp. NEAU 140]